MLQADRNCGSAEPSRRQWRHAILAMVRVLIERCEVACYVQDTDDFPGTARIVVIGPVDLSQKCNDRRVSGDRGEARGPRE